ncbi:hypothetical protein M0R45_026560 [Rubus argutus]|uniref:Uncharacterized protein n=1 Tax=Rubus argutus TaxID=59490 RepID=A0AAW1X1D5_RUBAR
MRSRKKRKEEAASPVLELYRLRRRAVSLPAPPNPAAVPPHARVAPPPQRSKPSEAIATAAQESSPCRAPLSWLQKRRREELRQYGLKKGKEKKKQPEKKIKVNGL